MLGVSKKIWLTLAFMLLGLSSVLADPGVSQAINPGSLIFTFQLAELSVTTVDTVGVDPNEPVNIFRPNQQGFKLGLGYAFSPRWSMNLSSIYGFSKDKFEPIGSPEQKISTSSLSLRFGFDAHFPISHAFSLYVGPGFMYTKAHSTVTTTSFAATTTKSNPWTSNFSISGRMGFVAKVSDLFGFYGDLGHQLVFGSVNTQGGNKANWTTSVPDGNVGVVFFIDTK